MTVTDVHASGGLVFGGSAATEFVHGARVDAGVGVFWDFDGDGDFDETVEDVTSYVYDLDTQTGRDWPSQLQGKAGPGRLRMRLDNRDGRFSYFNGDSPLNQNGNSLDPGRKVRVVAGVEVAEPQVEDFERTAFATAATSHLVRLPRHRTVGALLLAVYVSDGPAITLTTPSGWTAGSLASDANMLDTARVYSRVVDGTEADTVDVVTGTARNGVAHVYSIYPWFGDIATGLDMTAWTITTAGTSTSADPPSLTPSWGSAANLWLAVAFTDNDDTGTFAGAPTGYSDYRETPTVVGDTTMPCLASAERHLSATSENPGAYTHTHADDDGAITIAVRPPTSPVTVYPNPDPTLLARDRFDGALTPVTTDELGTTWTHLTPDVFVNADAAVATTEGEAHAMVIDVGAADYFVQATISQLGDNVLESSVQELNVARLIYRWADADDYSYVEVGPFDGFQIHTVEAFDVVAGSPTSIFGTLDLTTAGGAGVDAAGDHRDRVTVGVHVNGIEAHYYVNGCRVTSTAETALQPSATHVGLYAYWGLTNERPGFDQLAVWDTVPSSAEGVIWTGTVVDVFPDAPAPKTPQTVTVTAEGALATMAGVTIAPTAWAGQVRTGEAIGDAVERAGLLYPPGEIARGDMTAGSSSDTEIDALTHCRKLEEVEFGFLHEAPEGWLVYEDRSHRASLDTVATFSDQPGAQYGYQSLELLQWRRELVNKVTAGVSYGAPNLEVVGGVESGASAAGVTIVIDWPIPTIVIDPGDLFVVFITSTVSDDNEGWLVPQWWVRHRDTGASSSKRTQVYTHICDGNEGGTTVTFYNDSASNGGSFIIFWYQLRDWYGTHEGIHVGPWAVGESFAGADPETILPPWGDVNPSAFIAQRAGTSVGSAGAITNPTYPLGYVNSDDHFQNGSSNIHDCGMQVCSKLAMAAIEDASSFTGFTNLNNAETSVIAIRGRNGSPPEPRGRLRVTVEDVESQRRHGVTVTYDACDLFPDEDTADTWCQLMLSRYARLRPVIRLSFTATASGAYRALAYKLRLSDKVRVVATGDTGAGVDGLFHVENIAHRVTDGGKLWTVTVELSPAG